MTEKHYRNYSEQVFANVETLELIDIEEFDEFWTDDIIDLLYEVADVDRIIELYNEQCEAEGTPSDKVTKEELYTFDENSNKAELFQEFEQEYHSASLESIYQTYLVTLKGEYSTEHKKLEIVWNDEINGYIMPVYHFGMAWSMIGEMNAHYTEGGEF